jgi:ribose transport system ATP-binding protein
MQGTPEDVRTEPARLAVSGISKAFAGVQALEDVSVEFRPGEVHALLGENGAGKSTLMGISSGVLEPDSGTVTIAGEPYPSITPSLAQDLGIAIVHQHPALLPDMTVG